MGDQQLKSVDLQKSLEGLFPFSDFRKYQKETIEKIFEHYQNKKFVILEAPTGSGKSAIAMTVARIFGRSHILTIQKILQDQYKRDFPEIFVMKGRSNYQCLLREGATCDIGPCKAMKGEKRRAIMAGHFCPYTKARLEAERSNYTLHNFDSFFYQSAGFSIRPLMIIDEAHNIEQKFMSFISFSIDNKLIPIEIPKYEKTEEYKDFLFNYLKKIEDEIEKLEAIEEEEYNLVQLRFYEGLTRLQQKISIFLDSLGETDFINEYTKEGPYQRVVFKPVMVSKYTRLLFRYASKILLMSATILNVNQFARNSGIPLGDMAFVSVPSTFPIKNRTIYMTKELDLRWKTMKNFLPRIPNVIKRYLRMYEHERGIIHTHTNQLVDFIRRNVKSNRFVFKDSFKNINELLSYHKSRKNSVIVASGFHEGLDLVDDMSRFQIILKIPYPDLKDKQIAKRMETDKEYYGYLTALKIVQSYGRSVRSEEDYCDTYILDKNFSMFYGMYKKMLPVWFKEALKWD